MQNMPQWKVTGVMMIFSHFRSLTAKTVCAQHGTVKYTVDIAWRYIFRLIASRKVRREIF